MLLAHPAEDRWTPPQVSVRFLNRISGAISLVMLDGCGHFPVEEPGLSRLTDALRSRLIDAAAGDGLAGFARPSE